MLRYVVFRQRTQFCIERIAEDGTRVIVRRFATEGDAVEARKVLQNKAEANEDRRLISAYRIIP